MRALSALSIFWSVVQATMLILPLSITAVKLLNKQAQVSNLMTEILSFRALK